MLLGSLKADKKAWNGLKEDLLKVKALRAAQDAHLWAKCDKYENIFDLWHRH